ncbi:DMT family transporter [Micrococcus luteus]
MLMAAVAAGHAAKVFSSTHWFGIPIALLGAVFLAFGTIFQGRGVGAHGMRETSLRALVRRPVWLGGTAMLGAAVLLQLAALRFSPLMVVQPIGAAALVVTALVNARAANRPPGRRQAAAILLSVAGIATFVAVASTSAQDVEISDQHLRTILILLAVAVAAGLLVGARNRQHPSATLSTGAAGVLYGFVATLVKAVIGRLEQGDFAWLSLVGVAGLGVAVVVGARLVQKAHAGGSDELVVAGLTVVDPMTAVGLGIAVLGEADAAPPAAFAGFLAAGAAAVVGVWLLARAHGQDQPTVPGSRTRKG